MAHDDDERITGDIPATAKWEYPALKEALSVIEEDVQEKFSLTNQEMGILKVCDMIELVEFCLDEIALGNVKMKSIAETGIDAIHDRLKKHDINKPEVKRYVRNLYLKLGLDPTYAR